MFNFFHNTFALDISGQSVKIILLGGSESRPKLLAMGQRHFSEQVIDKGKIINKQSLAREINELFAHIQFGKIKKGGKCIFTIPGQNIYTHFFRTKKNLKKEELVKNIEQEVSITFPFALKDLYLDYMSYSGGEVSVVAAEKITIRDYLDVLKMCKIKPFILDTETHSEARVILGKSNKLLLIVNIGDEVTDLSLFDGEKLMISASTSVAGKSFTSAISKKMNISFSEAEKLKIKTGLNPDIEEGRVFLILQEELHAAIDEINEIIKYSVEVLGKSIDGMILTGGSAQMPYLSDYLDENLSQKVLVKDPWDKINIDILKRKEYFEQASSLNPIIYTNAIGLAMRSLSRNPLPSGINLIKNI